MKKHKTSTLVIFAVLTLLLFCGLLFSGNIGFYAKWMECGRKPLVARAKPGFQWYSESPTVALIRTHVWFCTPLEAEQAGYSANEYTWDRPHLREYLQQQDESN